MSKNEIIDASEEPATDTNLDGIIDLTDANNILQFYCRTLSGGKPLWSEYRKVTEFKGVMYQDEHLTRELGEDGKYVYTRTPKGDPRYIQFGRPGMFLEIGTASGKPGDYVAVPVYLSGCRLLAAFQMFINKCGDAELANIRLCGNKGYRSEGRVLTDYGVTNPDPYWGASVWVAPGGQNVDIPDGSVIAEYIYHIPEDAAPGTVYSLSVMQEETIFVTNGKELTPEENENEQYKTKYQYTLLDGAIYVE